MKIFVYGTLKRGYGNNRLLDGAKFISEAHTPAEYTMVSLGGFPGVIRGGETSIVGELWEVEDPIQLARIDRLEGHPNFYERHEVPVKVGDGDDAAWIYLLDDSYRKHNPVESGVWERGYR